MSKICGKCKREKTYSRFYRKWICEYCHKTKGSEVRK